MARVMELILFLKPRNQQSILKQTQIKKKIQILLSKIAIFLKSMIKKIQRKISESKGKKLNQF